jgi:transposase
MKVCGLDVHKDNVFVCIIVENNQLIQKEFSTLTPDLEQLKELLITAGVEKVAMESTGIYWMPIWRVLQTAKFDLKLVNPLFIKQLPGRKTDIKDAHWIATVLQKDLIKGSYIPEKGIQEMRQYERRYVHLSENITRVEQEIDRQLHRCNIRITNYASKIGSQSVMKVVKAIIDGETKPSELKKLIHGRITNKYKEKIEASLSGVISDADRFILKQNLEDWQMLNRQQRECLLNMEEKCDKLYKEELQLLITIPGIQKLSAMTLISETGVNLKTFATAVSLVGWAGLRPRNDQSAGKVKSRKTTNGNKYLRRILVQCAWGITRMKSGFLKSKYDALCKRMSAKKALIAIARKLLVIIWNILTKKEQYQEFKVKPDEVKLKKRIIKLEKELAELKTA